MWGLVALSAVAVLVALALRRVRDRLLTALGVAGLVMLAVPAVVVNGDVAERLVAAVYVYAPYWEAFVPLAFFALALMAAGGGKRGGGRGRRRGGRREEGHIVTV